MPNNFAVATRKKLYFPLLALVLVFSPNNVGTASAPGIERVEFENIGVSQSFINRSVLEFTIVTDAVQE